MVLKPHARHVSTTSSCPSSSSSSVSWLHGSQTACASCLHHILLPFLFLFLCLTAVLNLLPKRLRLGLLSPAHLPLLPFSPCLPQSLVLRISWACGQRQPKHLRQPASPCLPQSLVL